MGRRALATENRVGAGGNRFPKLDFKEKGERKRILLIDPSGPWQEYVHYLRAPKFKEGAPVMTTRERRGEEVPDYDTDFIGQPLCFGDLAVIEEVGLDVRNCPACEFAKDAPGEARMQPQLRFAANVVDQELRPNTWDIRRPYSAAICIWNFTSGMYDDIISLQEQHGQLIRVRDISLECTNAKFNQVKMGVMPEAGWQAANAGAYLKELLETPGNVATDDQLRDSCGRTVKRTFVEEDCRLCVKRWKRALELTGADEFGDSTAGKQLGGGQQDLKTAANALLNDSKPAEPARESTTLSPGTQPDPWADEARNAQAVAAVQQAKAEVRQELGLDTGGVPGPLDIFTAGGEDRAREQAAQAAEVRHGEGVDPFSSGDGSAPVSSPSAPSAESSQAAPAAPATSPTAAPPSEKSEPRKSSFDQLYQDLMGN